MLEVLSDTVIYFVLYAFIGWISEVIYAAYEEKRFVNRGVLAGPICPIYGFGAVLILGIDALIKPGTVPVYVSVALAVVVTTVLEYITGYILEKNFNIKAWDYSNEEFNLHGRICLKFSNFRVRKNWKDTCKNAPWNWKQRVCRGQKIFRPGLD